MNSPSVRDEFVKKLDSLTDEQVAALLHMVEAFESPNAPDNGETGDPAIGFVTGPTDFGRRAEEILYKDIQPKSGLTQKDKE
jgi:hypothetical protein